MARPRGPRRIPTCGHPNAKHHGNGLCWPCYYEANKQKIIANAKGHYGRNKGKAKYCTWVNFLRREYGMSVEDYEQKLAEQGGCCAICKMPPDPNERLCVDHCHRTDKIRGLLHRQCNLKLHVLELPTWLDQAYAYLHKWDPFPGGNW